MKAIGFIFARGGSKGLPRKNILPLAGKPLIAHAIESALASRYLQRVVVSTDDEEIADVARRFGADVPFLRPAELATDKASEWLAWQHAIRAIRETEGTDFDVFVSVPATSPLRRTEDVDACVDLLVESHADLVFAVTEAHRNPYFNMVVLDAERRARIVMGQGGAVRRQDVPEVYDVTTVAYAARADFVLSVSKMSDGDVRAVVVPPETAVDIDTELDFQFAEFLLTKRLAAESARKQS